MISAEVRNSDQIISDLLGFARTRPPARVDTLISELVSSALERFPPPENVRVTTGIPAHLPAVYVDRQHLALVLHNLISNAYQAMPEGGRLDISSRLEAGQVALSVTDSGCGISPGDRERIFEPLFTTKERGIGLGLAISRGLVEANGGSIEVESASGDGSIFTITLPVNIAGQSEP
jgi:signal transduction histidine kinase